MVQERKFRADLYYRLNVFPIKVPPLRERKEDIPLLVDHFIKRYSGKAEKKIKYVDQNVLELLAAHDWPGNIRELQNVVERGVVVSPADSLFVDRRWIGYTAAQPSPAKDGLSALVEREVQMIEAALQESQGRISGPAGAAIKLRIPRQTLESKMRRLGINKYPLKVGPPGAKTFSAAAAHA